MGRLHHLKQTFQVNLKIAAQYPNCEFILLNYGSQDQMHEWCKENMMKYIDKGIVKYFITKEPTYFSHSHAKNIAYKQATGDILVNLDADNYIVAGYIKFISDVLAKNECIIAAPPVDLFGNTGCFGKIALKKEYFYNVGGYEEAIDYGWGWEDNHLLNRAVWYNKVPVIFVDPSLCHTILHGDEERAENSKSKDLFLNEQLTKAKLLELQKTGDFVANKGRKWGYAKDLSDIYLNPIINDF